MQRIHFIAIGGGAMHNMAIALKNLGYAITGSDDEIYDPSYSLLKEHYLLPEHFGWYPDKITKSIEAVIIGGKIENNNPELLKAQELGIPIYSYTEYLYNFSKNKKRIVIAGSHGKNMISALVLHVLAYFERSCDFMLSMPVLGYTETVKLSDSDIIIIEGNEHVTSAIDQRSRLEHYKPHIALLSGISWELVNEYPTFEIYLQQFKKYISAIEKNGALVYAAEDTAVNQVVSEIAHSLRLIPYVMHPYEVFENRTYLRIRGGRWPISIFGEYNMKYVSAAQKLCGLLGIGTEDFYMALKTFKGTNKQLQLLGKNKLVNVFIDYIYSAVKLNNVIKAIREQYPKRELVVCLDLYTEAACDELRLAQYDGSLNLVDERIVYYDYNGMLKKGLNPIPPEKVQQAFGLAKLNVFTTIEDVKSELYIMNLNKKNVLFFSSDEKSKTEFKEIADKILKISDMAGRFA